MRVITILTLVLLFVGAARFASAQQTNPVDRQVANPLTDTPNINPISAQRDISAPKPRKPGLDPDINEGEVVVYSDHQSVEGEKGSRIVLHWGNVDFP